MAIFNSVAAATVLAGQSNSLHQNRRHVCTEQCDFEGFSLENALTLLAIPSAMVLAGGILWGAASFVPAHKEDSKIPEPIGEKFERDGNKGNEPYTYDIQFPKEIP